MYLFLYAVMLVLSALLLALSVVNWHHLRNGFITLRQNPGFYVLDALLTLFVGIEVSIRMGAQGKKCVCTGVCV